MATRQTTLVQATVLTVALTVSGSALGLGRDLFMARVFGANHATDAFVVAWTVPETAFPLLVEGAMSFLMVPLFSRACDRAGVKEVVAATLPPVLAILLLGSATAAVGAPILVALLAPGLDNPELAVTCTRLVSVTVLTFGLTGYLSAALRARHVFGAPATISLAYNVGILGVMGIFHGQLGIVSAAIGVALGSLVMAGVLVLSFLRHFGLPRRFTLSRSMIPLGLVAPIVVFTLSRQGQVFVERFLGSNLPPGTITHLNYAQKVAQVPMLVALLLCTVTFPTLARSVAAANAEAASRRLDADVRAVTALILLASTYMIVFAPLIVEVLFQHGRFGGGDTAITAAILRIYAIGLIGHALVGVLVRPYFAAARPTWYPAAAMAAGLGVTAVLAAASVAVGGAYAIAAANGIGILAAAILLLYGLRRRVLVSLSVAALSGAVLRLACVSASAGASGWVAKEAMSAISPVPTILVGGLLVLATFTGFAHITRCPEVTGLTSVALRKLRHEP